MAANLKSVTHCLFDMDGLLIDTETRYTEAFNRVLKKYGKTFTWEHKGATMGLQFNESAKKIIEMLDLPVTVEDFVNQVLPHYQDLFPTSQLLPDSESVYKTIYSNIVSEYGHKYEGDVEFLVLGRPERVGFKIIIDHFKLPLNVDEFGDKYHEWQRKLFNQVRVMPGVEKLLRHLHKQNIPIALATSSSEMSYELKTKHLKPIFELFHHRVLGSSDAEVKNGKPAPDIFLVCASRFPDKPDPSKCLVFEDSPNGVQAAVSANMQVVMVPDPNLPKNLREKATIVLNSMENFKPEVFGLPAFTD